MWAPKRLDIGWSDLAFACIQCFLPHVRTTSGAEVAARWIADEEALACLSVRSGLDLWLSALNLPKGSEVLMSAINIPDMAGVVRHHGLVVVPVDVDPQTLHVTAESVQKRISPQSRVLLVAHLFGRRVELDEIAAISKHHGLYLAEDCAQAFAGRGYTGHAGADATLFSFGPIKTATALGGAVLRVKDPEVLARMQALQATYPRQPRRQYVARILKYAALKLLTTGPIYGGFVRALQRLGLDHDRFIHGRLRSFNSHADLMKSLRHRPSEPLLRLLRRRVQRFEETELVSRTANGLRLAAGLARRDAPSIEPQESDTFWVFPHRTRDHAALAERLLANGFDIARKSSLIAIQPTEPQHTTPHVAENLVKSLVFLPCYKEMPPEEIDRVAELAATLEAGTSNVEERDRETAA
jgi:dTDP-4-amino-4,6-dideoxygalactose transaminase